MMSPDEALSSLKVLLEDLEIGCVDNNDYAAAIDFAEALTVAIACLEEKCHE